jgi:hypothetical protein
MFEGKTPGAMALTVTSLEAKEVARTLVKWFTAALETLSNKQT